MPSRRQLELGVLGAVLALAVILLVFFFVPAWVVTADEVPDAAERESLQNDVRTTGLQLLAGLVLATGAVFTARTYLLGREGQITERFSKAVEHLGHDDVNVNLGGIFALERIARDSPRDEVAVIEVLSAYVRVHAPWPSEHALPGGKRAEIAGAMDVLGRRPIALERDWQGRFRLDWVDLREGTYSGHFTDFRLENAHFESSMFRLASFDRAYLVECHFENALLRSVSFREASLVDLELRGATLEGVDLQGATIVGGTLRGVTLRDVHLEGANLSTADLRETSIWEIHTDEATLWPPGFSYSTTPR